MKLVYFDNAATSWPKPPEVMEAMNAAIAQYGASPGRSSHAMAVQASKIIFEARRNVARLIGVRNPNDIAFTLNTTMALNLALKGFLKPENHVICTNIEHNSVRRPLEYLRQTRNVHVSYVECNEHGHLNIKELERQIRPNTTLIVVNHSSNLLGNILPIAQIAEIAKKHNIKLLVDAAQSIGIIPINVHELGIDMLAFPGHKGLLGPQGTGGLYINPDIDLEPLLHGGTGSQSEAIEQPSVRPDRYEAGTPNTPGIAGLNAGVKFVLNETVDKIHTKEYMLTQRLMEGMESIPGVHMLGPKLGEPKTGVVSFIFDKIGSSEAAFALDRKYQIAVRAGYHCTPLAHETAGTLQYGAVRASISYYHTIDEIDYFIRAIREIEAQGV